LYLSKQGDPLPSNLIIGGYDLETYSPDNDFTFLPLLTETGYWAVEMSKVQVNNTNIEISGNAAILDSGSSLLLAPLAEA
jgi:hypothetical protein